LQRDRSLQEVLSPSFYPRGAKRVKRNFPHER
jgi:hypothetical protein